MNAVRLSPWFFLGVSLSEFTKAYHNRLAFEHMRRRTWQGIVNAIS